MDEKKAIALIALGEQVEAPSCQKPVNKTGLGYVSIEGYPLYHLLFLESGQIVFCVFVVVVFFFFFPKNSMF